MTTINAKTQPPDLNLNEVLSQAFSLYRRNFWRFVGIVSIFQVPLSLIHWVIADLNRRQIVAPTLPTSFTNPTDLSFPSGMINSVALTLLSSLAAVFLVSGLGTAAITQAISDTFFGRSGNILDTYRRIRNSWLPLISALFYGAVLAIILTLWMFVPCVGWISGIGMLVFLSMAIIPLIAPVIVIEDISPVAAYRRVWDLTRQRFWWITGFILILTIISQAVITGPSLLIYSAINSLLIGNLDKNILTSAIQSFATLLLSIIWNPLQLTAYVLLYFNLRINYEGLDITLQANQGETKPQKVEALLRQAHQPRPGKLITAKDFLNFIGLSAGIVLLYALLVIVIG